jgi:hypothetical protein
VVETLECPLCKGQITLPNGRFDETHYRDEKYEALCQCGSLLPFASVPGVDLKCPTCNSNVSIKYISHNDAKRANVESIGWQFVKSIFSYEISGLHWSVKNQQAQFEKFRLFADDIYSNHLSMRAKTIDMNKQVYFVFFLNFTDQYRVKLGPYNITQQDGFAMYLFNCVTIQTPEFIFSPLGRFSHDCPAVFQVSVNDSPAYYILHFATRLHPMNKAGKITVISPNGISFEYVFRVELKEKDGKDTEWHLLDGQLVPIKPSYTHGEFSINEKTLSKISEELGEKVASTLRIISSAKSKCSPSVTAFSLEEIESELQANGISVTKDQIQKIYEKRSGCFVVTACMGNEHHPYVVTMRQFRDTILTDSILGRQICNLYAIAGPPLASLIRKSNTFRKSVEILIVKPAVFVASLALTTPHASSMSQRRKNIKNAIDRSE